jgi:coenzyme PQQ precursor peptide PqqA
LRGKIRSTTLGALSKAQESTAEEIMAWTTPTLVEICIGLEINGYLPAEF